MAAPIRFVCLLVSIVGAGIAADLQDFAGTWKQDLTASQYPPASISPPVRFEKGVNGSLQRVTSGKPMTVHFDGKDYPNSNTGVAGDTYSWTQEGPSTYGLKTKRNGKPLGYTRYTVSPDGQTMTSELYGIRNNGVEEPRIKVGYRRSSGAGTDLEGTWTPVSQEVQFADAFILAVNSSGEMQIVNAEDPNQKSDWARADGKEYRVDASKPSGRTVRFELVQPRELRVTYFRDHRPETEATWTLSNDNKVLTMKSKSVRAASGSTTVYRRVSEGSH